MSLIKIEQINNLSQALQLYSKTVSGLGHFYRVGKIVYFVAEPNLKRESTINAWQVLQIGTIPSGYKPNFPDGQSDFMVPVQNGPIIGFMMRVYNTAIDWCNLSGSAITVPTTPVFTLTWWTNDDYPS
ncbi:hypothetical protein IJJ08_03810 [bacterium]|nr:hypothetical protein [bacterium]